MNENNYNKLSRFTPHFHFKALGFITYLSFIILVSCSSCKEDREGCEDINKPQEQENVISDKIIVEVETSNNIKEITEEELIFNSIALIMDDCGINEENTKTLAEIFPKAITLSYLPYAKNVQGQVNLGINNGHEIMLHLPMEAISYNEEGIETLKTSWSNEHLKEQTNSFLNAFEGYSSVNNHTGSKFTQDRVKMQVVLEELKERKLPFLDSMTISSSVAYNVAKEIKLPTAKRNIFIDHKADILYIYNQLLKAENLIGKGITPVVIGHPRDNTISALRLWLPTLDKKGIKLIPASKVYK